MTDTIYVVTFGYVDPEDDSLDMEVKKAFRTRNAAVDYVENTLRLKHTINSNTFSGTLDVVLDEDDIFEPDGSPIATWVDCYADIIATELGD